jgi:hypothetical protein
MVHYTNVQFIWFFSNYFALLRVQDENLDQAFARSVDHVASRTYYSKSEMQPQFLHFSFNRLSFQKYMKRALSDKFHFGPW